MIRLRCPECREDIELDEALFALDLYQCHACGYMIELHENKERPARGGKSAIMRRRLGMIWIAWLLTGGLAPRILVVGPGWKPEKEAK